MTELIKFDVLGAMNDRLLLIEKLIQKLKSGDTRSIHLDAIPGRYARLDIEDFNKIEAELSMDFLKKILTGQNFNFQIKIDPSKYSLLPTEERKSIQKISKRLNTLYYQEQDEYAEYGTMSLGWGFPLLIIKDPSNSAKTLKAPLIIWKLDIVKTTAQSNTWTIRKTDDHEVYFNQILKSYMEQHGGEKWADPFTSLQSDAIDLDAIQQVCNMIAETLQINSPKIQAQNLVDCSDKIAIEKLAAHQATIIPAGVLGMYKSQKQPIIQDLTHLLNKNPELTEEENQKAHQINSNDFLTPIVLDPSQEAVLHAIHEHGKVIIQGPPGTGKSQTLTAIITNALLEKKKVLVVCEKRTALEVIKNNLKPLGLEKYIALIEDVYKDRNLIVQSIRQQLDRPNYTESSFKHHQYEEIKSKYLQLRTVSNHRVSALFKKSFGDDNWIEIAQRHHELLSKYASLSFENLIPLTDTEQYYIQFKEWKTELENENPLLTKIQPSLKALYIKEKEWWLQRNENDISTFHEFQKISLELQNHIEASTNMFGEEFTINSTGKRFKSFALQVFSSQQKLIRSARFKTLELYQQYHLLSTKIHWKNKEVEQPLLMEDFKELSKYIEESLVSSTIVDQAIDQLPIIIQWINYTNKIPTQQGKLWEKLCEFEEKERVERFEEWFLRYFLQVYAQEHQIDWDGDELYQNLNQYHSAIQQILGEKIDEIWSQHAQSQIKQSDLSTKKMLYNLRKNKQYNSRNSLRSILQNDFEFFSSIFPIMMLNPVTASSILPLEKDLYDIIILDEASQLRIEDVYSVLYRAKTHVISGDEHQMPPSSYFSADISLNDETENIEEEKDIFLAQSSSLLEFSSDAGYYPSYLDFHYRSQHPDLIAFSNAGIYKSRLVPMPVKKSYQCMSFHAVNGTYQDSVNIEEAQAIVSYLFQLATEKEDDMPSIGIGTLNIQQRDTIQDLIWEQAYLDPKKGQLLDLMNQSGLFIKNLENIQGDERDIILIGTTFGMDSKQGFRQNFGPINRQQGYQLLNVLITRAKTAVHLFTSIPENYYRNFEEEITKNGNNGKGLFYTYIAYVKAVSESNLNQKNYILQLLDKHSDINTQSSKDHRDQLPKFVESLMEKHLSLPLQKQVKLGGFQLEGIIQKDLKKPLYFQSEQFSYHPQVHYKQMMYKESILKNYAISNYKIWPYTWWSAPKAELANVEKQIASQKS